jgi:hypothetical protein
MIAISNRGINPKTTPIYRKYRLYTKFQWVLIGGSILMLLYYCVGLFAVLPFTVDEGLSDGIVLLVLAGLCYLFQLRGSGQTTYLRVEGDDLSAAGGTVLLSDLDDVNIDSERLNHGKEWNERMSLPPQPEIISNTEIILASPDGVKTLHTTLTTSA